MDDIKYCGKINKYKEDVKTFNNIHNAIILLYENGFIDDNTTQQIVDNNIQLFCKKCYQNFKENEK